MMEGMAAEIPTPTVGSVLGQDTKQLIAPNGAFQFLEWHCHVCVHG